MLKFFWAGPGWYAGWQYDEVPKDAEVVIQVRP